MAAKKQVVAVVKLQLPAGQATPAPPVGPALAEHKINIAEFCKRFNDATKNEEKGLIIPAQITIYADRSFDFILKKPPASELLKRAAGVPKGSGQPNTVKVGKITTEQLRRIAEMKMPDMNVNSLEAAMKTLAGTARNMGIEIVES
ncbi:50S ribosomal protein L11 [bacterium HR07]|uniref:Large ribosomal subunit protein uL11 n=2 Tax=Candidatus Bipolaricaulota TaxID=67810 RepID=H5SJ89_9BACT|nr:50S ribosomal protein L11 [uncultured Acetothermia bacterium]BAL58187.1 50S ribosomal protein L11 [uncultured Acetothermia bacterium]BAL59901.1 50S ribosomal protein L11 [Candidatus Acetothermum autotrophicum]GBC75848.1 50S ribosomal protein L11 [bacterium HR07]